MHIFSLTISRFSKIWKFQVEKTILLVSLPLLRFEPATSSSSCMYYWLYFWKIFCLPLPTKRNWHLQAKLISYYLLNPDFWLKKRNDCTNKFGHGNQLSRHVLGPSKRKEREDCAMVLGSSREVVSFDEGAKSIDWSSCINRNYFFTSNSTILSNAVATIIELGAIHA